MRIPSGVTDQYIYFVAVDATDFVSREPGFSSFTVYRSRNGGTSTAMTTPTINETDATNMPGVYELLLDEDMTIDSGDDSQAMVFHITHAGMAPVTREIELYRPKITAGNTLDVTATGAAGIDLANVENPTATLNLSGTTIANLTNAPTIGDLTPTMKTSVTTAATSATPSVTVSDKSGFSLSSAGVLAIWGVLTSALTAIGSIGKKLADSAIQTGDNYARMGAPVGASISADIAAVKSVSDSLLVTVNKLDDTLEDDAGTFRFTAAALEQAPSGSGGGLDAAGVRDAVGLASANLDDQLTGIKRNTDLIPAVV